VKIGFSAEDFGHEAFLEAIRRRWCPHAELVKGHTRGRAGLRRAMEICKVCEELKAKDADIIVLAVDANSESWREVLDQQEARVPAAFEHCVIHAVAARNVECWLVLDRSRAAEAIGVDETKLDVDDPKPLVHRALGITTYDHKDNQLIELAHTMRFNIVLTGDSEAAKSLKRFYEDARDLAQRTGCSGFPNELEAPAP
jgi:hypothetical protein